MAIYIHFLLSTATIVRAKILVHLADGVGVRASHS